VWFKERGAVAGRRDTFTRVRRNRGELDRVKAHLASLSASLPELIERVRAVAQAQGRGEAVGAPLPDADQERQRLTAFGAYLDHYSRTDGDILGPVDAREVLEEAVALASGEIEPKARVTASYLPAPLVRGNPRQLGQVFVSLLINAAQAIPAGQPDVHRVDVELDTSEAGWARVAIADTGSGIAADALPHIFEPHYSTKRGAGMGIGLAIVREVIEGLGGRVSVESELGRGTLFIIELPAVP
jgi:signal transduction histidine kinase